ncbi:hypothetical protein BASA62_008272 [Batrachochytrium salamandrivorans]|nr:hypothetical protein BASA62_008272 [Batrachochytrium salamandrivorans]
MDNSTLAFASLRDEQDSSGSHETSMVDAAGNGTSLQYGPDVTSAAFSLNSYVDQDPQQEMPQLPAPLREKTSFCCEIDTAFTSAATQKFLPPIQSDISLRDQPRPAIEITEAVKAHDMSGISYIAYVIHTRLPEYNISLEAKHRYSEFESLRKLLTKAYPTSVVPPIPEKHTVAAYAAKPGKAKEDPHIILLRKRMLQTFLNRVASHPILSSSHVFHLFIKGIAPWSEILTSSGLAHLLKRKDTILPVSEKSVLRKPDAHFVAAEDYTIRFMSQILYIEKIHKRIITHHTEMATTYADLGGSYNGWSLTESTLADSIEQTGQAIDSTVTATNAMRLQLQERFDEMLHEYALFSLNIEKLLRWRHRKHAEFEGISESLILKQAALVRLEQAEHESLRLSAALNSESGGGGYTSSAISASNHDWSTAATTTTTSTATTDHYSSGGSIPPSVSDPHSSATRFNETDVDHNGLAATTASTTPTLLNSQYGAGGSDSHISTTDNTL